LVVWGEFGRTPRIKRQTAAATIGRASACPGGGRGLRMARSSARPTAGRGAPHAPDSLPGRLRTLYQQLGIDVATTQFTDLSGRPQYLVGEHRPVAELIGSRR